MEYRMFMNQPKQMMRARSCIVALIIGLLVSHINQAAAEIPSAPTPEASPSILRKINFVFKARRRTPNPPGWEEYDGALYTKERGYGWLTDVSRDGWDGGGTGEMILPDGTKASPIALGRLELANWQGTHQENLPLVFRLDLPNGWYRITCTSVDPDNAPLPLVDQRSVKFRAHDVVFAGPNYGAPLKVEGNRLIEGSSVVEVTDGHLRIVVGDPAYGGWTWSYAGPWFQGWRSWFGKWGNQRYATNWYQKLTRTVDPGFHSLRLNSLVVERASAPSVEPTVLFRDFFHRDDHADINAGVAVDEQWKRLALGASSAHDLGIDLYKSALRVTSASRGKGSVGLVQGKLSPSAGTTRYSARVSLFTGEGSKLHSGYQEAGLLLFADPRGPTDFNATFLGVVFDGHRPETVGGVILRVGDGSGGFWTDLHLPNARLPFMVTEGEYEIIADHDVEANTLRRVLINGFDITPLIPSESRALRVARGLFGIRSVLDPRESGVKLQHFYWSYRVEAV
jgi:hypothetical protein